jgi:hypothetical protein
MGFMPCDASGKKRQEGQASLHWLIST